MASFFLRLHLFNNSASVSLHFSPLEIINFIRTLKRVIIFHASSILGIQMSAFAKRISKRQIRAEFPLVRMAWL